MLVFAWQIQVAQLIKCVQPHQVAQQILCSVYVMKLAMECQYICHCNISGHIILVLSSGLSHRKHAAQRRGRLCQPHRYVLLHLLFLQYCNSVSHLVLKWPGVCGIY